MSLHGSTPVGFAQARVWFRRYYQGPSITLVVESGRLKVTANHPLLCHVGWRPAWQVEPDWWVVRADTPHQRLVEHCWEHPRHPASSVGLPGGGHDFWGDGDRFSVEAVVFDPHYDLRRPLRGGEGDLPAVDPQTVRGVLEVVTSAEAFGCATWERAVSTVPRLAQRWPSGPPTRKAAGVGATQRYRLGAAVAELPEPPVDTLAWGQALTGLRAPLRLARVEAVEKTLGGGEVYDLDTTAGCVVAAGVVVG